MKKLYMVLGVIFIIFLIESCFYNVYALGGEFSENIYNEFNNGDVNQGIQNVGIRIYGTIALIIKVVAVAGVVYTGYRYMTAGAGDKGLMKQTLIWVIVGAIFVFSADAIVNFVIDSNIFVS